MERRGRIGWLVPGHVAEDIVAAIHPDWIRAKPFTKAHDFIKPDGGKVEIKAISGKAKVAKVNAGHRDTTWLKPGAAWVIIFLFDGIKWKILCDCPIAPELWLDPKNLIPKGRYEGCLIWQRAWDRIIVPRAKISSSRTPREKNKGRHAKKG
jgi:hypothetical protein